jgi:hypothetical protein
MNRVRAAGMANITFHTINNLRSRPSLIHAMTNQAMAIARSDTKTTQQRI